MKLLFINIFLLTGLLLFGQTNNATLNFSVTNIQGDAFQGNVYFYSVNTGTSYSAQASEKGTGTIELPINEIYSIYIDGSETKYDFQIPNYPGLAFQQNFIFNIPQTAFVSATPTHGVANLQVINPQGGYIHEQITITNETFTDTIISDLDSLGRTSVKLPVNRTYSISFQSAPNFSSVTIPQEPFFYIDKKIAYEGSKKGSLYPSETNAVITFMYKDLHNDPAEGELISATNLANGKVFQGTTDKNGKTQILAPIGAEYSLSTKYFTKIASVLIPATQGKYIFDASYKNSTTKQIEAHRKELADRAEEYDTKWKAEALRIDSIQKEQYRKWLLYVNETEAKRIQDEKEAELAIIREKAIKDSLVLKNKLEQEALKREIAQLDSTQKVRKQFCADSLRKQALINKAIKEKEDNELETKLLAEQKVAQIKYKEDQIKWNAEYETNNNVWGDKRVIFTVIKRQNWTKALFVVDVTGSMYPYAQMMKNWFILNLHQQDTIHFAFFNDGNGKLNKDKEIGKTGGVFICKDCGISQIDKIMRSATKWRGGDLPENDIEALLVAKDSISNFEELVLLADNNSPVRDYSLLYLLDKPVRVVLCGVENDVINEEYLNIAQQTKGSIHTLEEDINFLKSLTDGEILSVGNRKYMFINNSFRRYN